jgi:hypothetical protein
MRAISVDRMSYKDASAKQLQDYLCCDFNHFNAPTFTTGTSIIDPGFGPASSGPKNDFVRRPPWAVVNRYPGQSPPAIIGTERTGSAPGFGPRSQA